MLTQSEDGTVTDKQGKIHWFSFERFVRDICEGNCCFICGTKPGTVSFNDEHVLPDWLLRHCNIHHRTVNLPNGTTFRYDQYTIPCCSSCNTMLGREVEEPIRELVSKGPDEVRKYLTTHGNHGRLLFSTWMALIFVKTHLKDRHLRMYRDQRKPDDPISSMYSWEELHHIHCLARSIYTGCRIEPNVFGSFVVLPVRHEGVQDEFDFIDLTYAQTMLLRVGDIAFITVFDDSGGVFTVVRRRIELFTTALAPIQLRELTAEFAFLNVHLAERPTYQSVFDFNQGIVSMVATRPSEIVRLHDLEPRIFGRFMYALLGGMLEQIQLTKLKNDNTLELLKEGRITFLFDDDGKFIEGPIAVQKQ